MLYMTEIKEWGIVMMKSSPTPSQTHNPPGCHWAAITAALSRLTSTILLMWGMSLSMRTSTNMTNARHTFFRTSGSSSEAKKNKFWRRRKKYMEFHDGHMGIYLVFLILIKERRKIIPHKTSHPDLCTEIVLNLSATMFFYPKLIHHVSLPHLLYEDNIIFTRKYLYHIPNVIAKVVLLGIICLYHFRNVNVPSIFIH